MRIAHGVSRRPVRAVYVGQRPGGMGLHQKAHTLADVGAAERVPSVRAIRARLHAPNGYVGLAELIGA